MSDSPTVHRGPAGAVNGSKRRGASVSRPEIANFLGTSTDVATTERQPVVSVAPSGAQVIQLETALTAGNLKTRRGQIDAPTAAPTARVALLHLGDAGFDSTVALAVALAAEAAAGSGSRGAVVTVDSSLVRLASGRRRRQAIALRGFEPAGRSGSVTLLDASDAEPASIAACGVVPIVCVIETGQSPAVELKKICPSSLLIVAGAEVDNGYLELFAADVGRSSAAAPARVLRYASGDQDADVSGCLTADRSASLRLRLALSPGPRSRANAEIAVAALARA